MSNQANYAASQQLKAITTDWGAVAKSGNDREALLYKRREAEKAERQKKRDAIDYDNLESVITGIDSLDQGLAIGIGEASTMQHEDYKKARENPAYADSTEYKIRTKNLNNYSKNVAELSKGLTAFSEQVIKKSQDGTLSSWDNDLLDTLNGAYVSERTKFGVDSQGRVEAYIASTNRDAITDENPEGFVYDEDGKIKMTKVTPNEVFKGLGGFSITEDVDIVDLAKGIGTELGTSIDTSINGYTTTTSQLWENRKEDARTLVQSSLGTPSNPSSLAKRIWADELGQDSRTLSAADMTTIEDEMLKNIKGYYDVEVEKTKNFAAQAAANKAYQDSLKEGNTNEPQAGDGLAIAYGTDGKVLKEKTSSGERVVFTMPVVKDKKGMSSPKIIVDIDGESTSIENIYLDTNGMISYEGWVNSGKVTGLSPEGSETITSGNEVYSAPGEGKMSKNINKKVTNLEKSKKSKLLKGLPLNKVARGLGFNNANELKKHLMKLRDGTGVADSIFNTPPSPSEDN